MVSRTATLAPEALEAGCWLEDRLLCDWERRLLAGVQVAVLRGRAWYWNLDALDAATLTALCQPRAGA